MKGVNEIRKFVLLVRMNVAWPLSDWRPIDVREVSPQAWDVVYQHRWTGELRTMGLLKSELDRAECNMGDGKFRRVVSAVQDEDGLVLFSSWRRCSRKRAMSW